MSLQIGTIYNFNTLVSSILGATYKNASLVGMVNYAGALKYINVAQMQANIQPLLPSGTPTDATKYIYYIFKLQDGSQFITADQWLDATSIVPVTTTTLTVVITGAGPADITPIKNALVLLGYSNLVITQS